MMSKRVVVIMGAVLGIALLAGGIWLYDWVLGETLEASQPATAIPIEAAPSETATNPPPTAPEYQGPVEDTELETEGESQEISPVEATPETEGSEVSPSLSRLIISQDESFARFKIFEELNGQPTDVVGVTNQTAGEVEVHWVDLSQTRVGVITVNARTLATDQDRRNQAIRNRILHTDQYEYVTFTPTVISGLNGSAEVGQTYSFQIAGDLTIREISQPVVFNTTVTIESMERLPGTATTEIRRSDFDLLIPNVPFVANVGEVVGLEIDFVLVPAS